MALEVYLDESGTHDQSPVVSVSAVWATRDEWVDWTVEWLKAQAPIKFHHSVDCHNRSGEFRGWDQGERDKYVKRILSVIRDRNICGHFACIDVAEISRLLMARYEIQVTPREMIRGYYFICLSWAIRSACDVLLREGWKEITFIHEDNDFLDEATRAFNYVSAEFPDAVLSFRFGSKAAYTPLQCADILAYEGNRQVHGGWKRPLRKPLEAIDPIGKRFGFLKYDQTQVGPIVDFMASRLRSG